MSSDRIAVTGSTGRIGGRVAHGLAERGIPLRLSVRDADRAPQLPDSEVVEGSYSESETLLDVFDNIDTVFFVSAPESVDFIRQHDIFLGSALSAGVRNVVYLSYYGAMRDATCSTARAHWHTEQILRDRGARWTFLRDNVYADQLPLMVGSDDVIHAPVKKGRVAAVDPDDVVEVAIEVLTDPARHNHMAYELTGPESLSFARIGSCCPRRAATTSRSRISRFRMRTARALARPSHGRWKHWCPRTWL